MKLLRNYRIALVLALSVVIISCGREPIEHGTEYILECATDTDTAEISATVDVIKHRLDNFGIEGDYEISHDSTRIKVRIRQGAVSDPSQMTNVLQSSAVLKFRATYNAGEISPTLLKAQDIYLRIHHIDSADVPRAGFGAFVVASAQDANSAQIFCCRAKDTAACMSILRTDSVAAILPSDVVFHWGKGVVLENGEESMGLFACKEGRNYVMSGNYVESASTRPGDNGGGYVISLVFNDAGTKEFARITKANIGRCLAIELDDYVYSYPTVNSEITGGKAEITGNFNQVEADELAKMLSAGSLPVRCAMVIVNTF